MQTFTNNVQSPTGEPDLLDIVLTALRAKGRLGDHTPAGNLPLHFTRGNLLALHVDKRPGGWVGNVEFRDVPDGAPNCVGTPEYLPFEDPLDAFLMGAAIVCEIASGSPELPFVVQNGQLTCIVYGG